MNLENMVMEGKGRRDVEVELKGGRERGARKWMNIRRGGREKRETKTYLVRRRRVVDGCVEKEGCLERKWKEGSQGREGGGGPRSASSEESERRGDATDGGAGGRGKDSQFWPLTYERRREGRVWWATLEVALKKEGRTVLILT